MILPSIYFIYILRYLKIQINRKDEKVYLKSFLDVSKILLQKYFYKNLIVNNLVSFHLTL